MDQKSPRGDVGRIKDQSLQPASFKSFSLVATFAVIVAMLILLAVERNTGRPAGKTTSNHDSLSFNVPFGQDVAIRITTAARYGLSTDSDDEWDRILPAGGHLVYLSDNGKSDPVPHSVTLFHQLGCLRILREEYRTAENEPSPSAQHCFNYLRQTILCQLNLRLESVRTETGLTDHNYYDAVCRDWSKVYDEAERNQRAYTVWKKSS